MGLTRNSNVTRGASIMVICVAFAKFLGIVWVIPVNSLIGQSGLGIYSSAYAIYTILQQLATSGFPLAMSKLISERVAMKRYEEIEQIYRVALRTILLLGVVAFLLMWFGAPIYAWLTAVRDPAQAAHEIVPSVRALSFMLLIIPLMSGLRGYLQGFQMLEAPAYSQAIEQIFRVLAMVIGSYMVMRTTHNIINGAAAATFGAVVGALAGTILLFFAVKPLRKEYAHLDIEELRHTRKRTLKMLYHVALPVSLGGLVVPISNQADAFTVQNLLMSVGDTLHQSIDAYGVLTRQALYLIQLPLAFAYAIGVSVLPAISTAKAKKEQSTIQSTVTGTFRSMFFITFPTAAILLVLARPICYTLYGSYDGAPIIAAVSFMCIFSSLELISTYMLQGVGKMYRPVRNMFIGVAIKVLFNFILILAFKNVIGAAIATTIGYLCSSLLNTQAVKKYSHTHFSIIRLAIPFILPTIPLLLLLFISNWITFWAGSSIINPSSRILSLLQVFIATGFGVLIYLYFTIRIGAIREYEFRNIPGIGRRLSGIATRLYKRI